MVDNSVFPTLLWLFGCLRLYHKMKDIHTKKAWHYFAFIGISEVLDYLFLPITTIQPTPFGGSAVALLWEEFLKVSKFQKFPNKTTSLFPIL